MLFSSTLFLFLFLPVVLLGQFIIHPKLRNTWLLLGSLVFYGWGEPFFIGLMLISVAVNWALGLWVARDKTSLPPLILTIVFNVGLLLLFKYTDWLTAMSTDVLMHLGLRDTPVPRLSELWPKNSSLYTDLFTPGGYIRLPIGISFFTFHAISYVLDVRRSKVAAQRNPFDLALYISLFPQLVAGPIVRYCDVHDQIKNRVITVDGFTLGIRRFVIGLGKKMLIANTAAECADACFGIPLEQLPPAVAWLGIFCYTVQIYFDFSGYSDMALGLGHMIGFRFLENFNYPYIAKSITEFWRRWHISLSTWFRDYLYIPLGGNRAGPARTYFNLVLVFGLCGMWHGASFSFLVWGLFHGAFLVLERVGLGNLLDRSHAAVRHAYVLLVVMIGWVFFRANDFEHAIGYLKAMAFLQSGDPKIWYLALWNEPPLLMALPASCIAATPVLPWLETKLAPKLDGSSPLAAIAIRTFGLAALFTITFACCMFMAAGTYNPFIYFRF